MLEKAEQLFSDVASLIVKVKSPPTRNHGPRMEFHQVEKMWRDEKSAFEVSLAARIFMTSLYSYFFFVGCLAQTVLSRSSLTLFSSALGLPGEDHKRGAGVTKRAQNTGLAFPESGASPGAVHMGPPDRFPLLCRRRALPSARSRRRRSWDHRR